MHLVYSDASGVNLAFPLLMPCGFHLVVVAWWFRPVFFEIQQPASMICGASG